MSKEIIIHLQIIPQPTQQLETHPIQHGLVKA